MFLGIDLGSTNIKAMLFDEELHVLAQQSQPVVYLREGGFVEFDAEAYSRSLQALIAGLTAQIPGAAVTQIALTGQAESLVCVDADGNACMNAISWMDERSQKQCEVLAAQFDAKTCAQITGQLAVLPTWPASKILWLRENRPDVFARTAKFMLLKDYIVYKLTGSMLADMSIATFTFYFDIYRKCYWTPMLDAIGIDESRLPPLAEPCSIAGPLTAQAAEAMGLSRQTLVNIGTLDHFAGMIGTGNTTPGGVTLSTGTVMALAVMAREPAVRDCGIALHYGFLPDTHVMLPVAESGGVSLEWFRRTCMGDTSYEEMNRVLLTRTEQARQQPIFLPYLVGTNAPEFDTAATGMFWGLRQEHDRFDLAHAVMEGVAFMLRRNCDAIRTAGTELRQIVATGGGAKSPVWCQLQADITGLPVVVPQQTEAACLGAAMAAAVSAGRYADYASAASACVAVRERYLPHPTALLDRRYRQFALLYRADMEAASIE